MSRIELLEEIYSNTARNQEPVIDKIVTREELDTYIESNKSKIIDILDGGILCIYPFKNAFLISDRGYGGVCDKCGSDIVAVHLEDVREDIDEYKTVFLPSYESYTFFTPDEKSCVCPLNTDDVRDGKVSYRSICCNNEWKKLIYDEDLGLCYKEF